MCWNFNSTINRISLKWKNHKNGIFLAEICVKFASYGTRGASRQLARTGSCFHQLLEVIE